MARAKTKASVHTGPVCCVDGEKAVAMPDDLTTHAALTLDEIRTFPEVKWSEELQAWEYVGE